MKATHNKFLDILFQYFILNDEGEHLVSESVAKQRNMTTPPITMNYKTDAFLKFEKLKQISNSFQSFVNGNLFAEQFVTMNHDFLLFLCEKYKINYDEFIMAINNWVKNENHHNGSLITYWLNYFGCGYTMYSMPLEYKQMHTLALLAQHNNKFISNVLLIQIKMELEKLSGLLMYLMQMPILVNQNELLFYQNIEDIFTNTVKSTSLDKYLTNQLKIQYMFVVEVMKRTNLSF